ncbi:hypothetical protein NC653_034773 [Populus alba x Populus x berolinensis]|uniref:Uncharacterized protein n=1 Tax=Populus alba x Populus x berolinensis TaxID=444605 RepID=A0AAD6PWE6_9ROSI|nr:hypothetical protein NC653_034773 [Populus alba x Populus x berolinensis]
MEESESFHSEVTIDSIYYYGKLVYPNVNLRFYFRSPPTTKISLDRCVILYFSKKKFFFFPSP